jgi:hypothetical protein
MTDRERPRAGGCDTMRRAGAAVVRVRDRGSYIAAWAVTTRHGTAEVFLMRTLSSRVERVQWKFFRFSE